MWSVRHSVVVGLLSSLLVAGAFAETRLKLPGDDAAADSKQADGQDQATDKPAKDGDDRAPAKRQVRGNAKADAKSAQTTKASAKSPAKRTPRKATKIPPAANTITQELKGEFERGKLRTKSDYLTAEPNAEMTANVVVAMLSRRLGTSDSMDAYIKWQLLSGLPETVPDELAGDAVAAYRNAPSIVWRPGITQDEKKMLDREVKRVENARDVTAMLVDETRRIDILNEPVIKYREELFSRLPDKFETMQAALVDMYQRGEAGITPRKFFDQVASRVSAWSKDANEGELADMSNMLDELLDAKMPEYYETLRFEEKDSIYRWESRKANLNDGSKLEDLAEEIGRKVSR